MAEKNALAELAEEMQSIINALETDNFSTVGIGNLCKARRIVAELAKVKLNGVGWPARVELADAYEMCRAIAEEV